VRWSALLDWLYNHRRRHSPGKQNQPARALHLEVVGEVPGAQAAGLEPDKGVVVAAVRVGPALLAAEVPDSNVADYVGVGATEHRAASDLDAAIGRVVLEDDNARPGVSAELARLHVVYARHDVEAAVSPAVPDRREEHVAIGAVSREDGDEGTLEQPVEIVGAEALSHGGESSHTWHVHIADAATATDAPRCATRPRRTVVLEGTDADEATAYREPEQPATSRDGREHAIELLDALNAPEFDPWTLVDAAWTRNKPVAVSPETKAMA
jgi:hypothetical protein